MAPRRDPYRFDNPLPAIPNPRTPDTYQPQPLSPFDGPAGVPVVVQHVHTAPPDRTAQRLALGAGVGSGAVAAGVYFGPLLVGALTAIAFDLAMLALFAAVAGWAVVRVVAGIRKEH
ncbi:DUF6251 family protein [Streptomyces sp. ICBB 8177]|uniref:DUF6251 family protein n=1 Tax=Streptomyces sp. ICBB 8177 TaxID=563922 RepID=UPI000D6774E9|nr:DUF6251 family protein [Streptomyces sp. ICBB 8177]PWI41143.1 hypothetical protein CK485_27775 [Streptomyces sp. ICBB 8177]